MLLTYNIYIYLCIKTSVALMYVLPWYAIITYLLTINSGIEHWACNSTSHGQLRHIGDNLFHNEEFPPLPQPVFQPNVFTPFTSSICPIPFSVLLCFKPSKPVTKPKNIAHSKLIFACPECSTTYCVSTFFSFSVHVIKKKQSKFLYLVILFPHPTFQFQFKIGLVVLF